MSGRSFVKMKVIVSIMRFTVKNGSLLKSYVEIAVIRSLISVPDLGNILPKTFSTIKFSTLGDKISIAFDHLLMTFTIPGFSIIV
jgi:hypothetical protein